MTVATIGEMIMFPVNKALAANFHPADMRGRYMAIYDLGWTIPATIGPAAAGLILDNYNPDLLWYIGGVMCAFAAFGFLRPASLAWAAASFHRLRRRNEFQS